MRGQGLRLIRVMASCLIIAFLFIGSEQGEGGNACKGSAEDDCLDCLKIDRSFIDGMGREREAAAIVHSIIHLGRALGLEVVAEGVETEAHLAALRVAGVRGLHPHQLPCDPWLPCVPWLP